MKTLKWIVGSCALLIMAAVACSPNASSGQNPIVAAHPCTAPDNGSREGYHAPGNDHWLPDCKPMLNREYWRVFVADGTD